MAGNTKEVGNEIYVTAKVSRGTLTAIVILAISRWVKLMAKAFIHGLMEKYTMVNGFRG